MLCSCSWHRVTPVTVEQPSRLSLTLGMAAQDEQTSLEDLKNISNILAGWGTADRVQFPWREGDEVDVVATVRLTQRVELATGRNLLAAVGIGLTFLALSCCIGSELSEVHTIEARFVDREGRLLGTHSGELSTTLESGLLSDPMAAARETDHRQMEQVARLLAEWLFEDRARARRELPSAPIRR